MPPSIREIGKPFARIFQGPAKVPISVCHACLPPQESHNFFGLKKFKRVFHSALTKKFLGLLHINEVQEFSGVVEKKLPEMLWREIGPVLTRLRGLKKVIKAILFIISKSFEVYS